MVSRKRRKRGGDRNRALLLSFEKSDCSDSRENTAHGMFGAPKRSFGPLVIYIGDVNSYASTLSAKGYAGGRVSARRTPALG